MGDPVRDCKHGNRLGKCDTCELIAAEKRITELEALVEQAFIAGYTSGHNDGIGCGHSLAPRCRHKASEEWADYSKEMEQNDG